MNTKFLVLLLVLLGLCQAQTGFRWNAWQSQVPSYQLTDKNYAGLYPTLPANLVGPRYVYDAYHVRMMNKKRQIVHNGWIYHKQTSGRGGPVYQYDGWGNGYQTGYLARRMRKALKKAAAKKFLQKQLKRFFH